MTAKTTAQLSPTVHESTITRHFLSRDDEDDTILVALRDSVKMAREMSTKAGDVTTAVLNNQLETLPRRHKKARDTGFELLERATKALDAASKAAQAEVEALRAKTRGPPVTKDVVTENRQRELRERLAMLPREQQSAIIKEAVDHGDDNILAAILNVPPFIASMTLPEQNIWRHAWASKRHPAELDRLERIEKAITDAHRAGSLSIGFVASLTDAALIEDAEKAEKLSNEALRSAAKS